MMLFFSLFASFFVKQIRLALGLTALGTRMQTGLEFASLPYFARTMSHGLRVSRRCFDGSGSST